MIFVFFQAKTILLKQQIQRDDGVAVSEGTVVGIR
jgi:hypothetical protein